MSLSALAKAIGEPATLRLNERANMLKARGEAVIHLGSGEPMSPAPQGAIDSAMAMLAGAEVKYTPTSGTAALKKAVIDYTTEHYGVEVAVANVVVAAGAKMALYSALTALVEPGDEVVFPAPYWVSYPEMIRMMRGVPVQVRAGDNGFEPTVDEMLAVFGPKTKACILNSPNNPSGAVYSLAFIRAMVEACEERGVWLIMDDIYNRLVFDGRKAPSVYSFTRLDPDHGRIIVINGVSKMYGMTGFRIGWAIGSRSVISVMKNVLAQTTSCPSALSQAAALGAMTGPQDSVAELAGFLERHRNLMFSALEQVAGVQITKPGGTFYCLPDFSRIDPSSARLSEFLLDKALVVTVPGFDFGMEGHLRLSYCGTEYEVLEGVRRIKWALDPSSPAEIEIGGRTVVRDW